MPTSASDYFPTPYITHTTKSGQPIESAQVKVDFSTIDEIPSTEANTNGTSSNSKLLKIGAAVLITLVLCAAIAVLFVILLSKSTGSTTTVTTTTATTMTTTSATTRTSTMTTSTVTTTTSTTTTTTTTTTTGSTLECASNETVYGVWNTIAGGNSMVSTSGTGVGNYYTTQIPIYACDNDISTIYTNFGNCTSASNLATCGLNTGFYRTPQRGASLLVGLQICTGSSLNQRDPITITLEGSNQPVSALNLGSSWTLIYSGPSGLATDPGRSACGIPQLFLSNTVWYTSYRFLVTSIRSAQSSTWYSEVTFIGY